MGLAGLLLALSARLLARIALAKAAAVAEPAAAGAGAGAGAAAAAGAAAEEETQMPCVMPQSKAEGAGVGHKGALQGPTRMNPLQPADAAECEDVAEQHAETGRWDSHPDAEYDCATRVQVDREVQQEVQQTAAAAAELAFGSL